MYALSLTQPWASLIAIGAKKIETRSWPTSYRGTIAIHASKGFPKWAKYTCYQPPFFSALKPHGLIAHQRYPEHLPDLQLPLGAIVALADLVDCQSTDKLVEAFRACKFGAEIGEQELPFGDFSPGRYGFILTNVRPLKEPIPCKGVLNPWKVPADVENQINYQIADSLA